MNARQPMAERHVLSDGLRLPSWITFQLLERCNLRCRMCYEWGDTGAYHTQGKPASLELPLLLRLIEECLPGKPLFEFFGGEPLLYPGIFEAIARIRSGGSEVAFPTNGTLLEDFAERLVDVAPTRVWVSLDGPAEVNDRQRGVGVFARALRGIEAVARRKSATGTAAPQLGVTCVVTPENWRDIETLFLRDLDLGLLSLVSIELQSYVTADQARTYTDFVEARWGTRSTPYAEAYVRDPRMFAAIDVESVSRQMRRVRCACEERGITFYSQPKTLAPENLRHYFAGEWQAMSDWKPRCGVPWVALEISARGAVTTCHSFYELTLGNVHDQSLLDIWRGARLQELRAHLRDQLLPICTACCRYYGGAGALAGRKAHA